MGVPKARPDKPNRCIVCGEPAATGLVVLESVICERCEQLLTRSCPESNDYDNLVTGMKRLWSVSGIVFNEG